MLSLPNSAESKLPDKYSPLLYMVKIELTSAGCSLCFHRKGKKTRVSQTDSYTNKSNK